MSHPNNISITIYGALISAGSKHKTLYRGGTSPIWQMAGQGSERRSHWPRSHSRAVIHTGVSPAAPPILPPGMISFLVSPEGLKCTTLASQTHTRDFLLPKYCAPKDRQKFLGNMLPRAQLLHQQTFNKRSHRKEKPAHRNKE